MGTEATLSTGRTDDPKGLSYSDPDSIATVEKVFDHYGKPFQHYLRNSNGPAERPVPGNNGPGAINEGKLEEFFTVLHQDHLSLIRQYAWVRRLVLPDSETSCSILPELGRSIFLKLYAILSMRFDGIFLNPAPWIIALVYRETLPGDPLRCLLVDRTALFTTLEEWRRLYAKTEDDRGALPEQYIRDLIF